MHSLETIAAIIESRAIAMYGSVNKMLSENQLSKSVLDNMKRAKPSAPSILTFCKLAEAVQLSADTLLGLSSGSPQLSIDEQMLLESYRELDDEGKALLQNSLRHLWAAHGQPTEKPDKGKFFSDKK